MTAARGIDRGCLYGGEGRSLIRWIGPERTFDPYDRMSPSDVERTFRSRPQTQQLGDSGQWSSPRRYRRHSCVLALIAAINSNALTITGISGVGEKPSSAGARTACA